MSIRILQDQVINRIAAGEVVERPASVLKELLENALDAQASKISVDLGHGGRNLIQVTDDGTGMDRHDALLCIERHATSKIRSDADLLTIASLGFRGEALPSIASVSRFQLVTRPQHLEEGTRIEMAAGKLLSVEACGCPTGTRATVRDLFFNLPARRKFLRTVPTELSHCVEALTRVALVRPQTDFSLRHQGRESLVAPRASGMAERARDILGTVGESLKQIAFERGSLRVNGLISPIGVHRQSARGSSYFFVNGRFVRDMFLRRAVTEAYHGLVPLKRFPVVILDIELPPSDVDVNVHPTKVEVRFRHAGRLSRTLAEGLRQSLKDHGIHRPASPRPRPVPIVPSPPSQGTLPLGAGPLFPPGRQAGRPETTSDSAMMASSPSPAGGGMHGQEPRPHSSQPETTVQSTTAPVAPRSAAQPHPVPQSRATTGTQAPGIPHPAPASPWERSYDPAPEPAATAMVHDGAGASQPGPRALLPPSGFSGLRVIGQLDRTYILCEAPGRDGSADLVLIDQHAAHERVTLNHMERERRSGPLSSQRLLQPALVDLSPGTNAIMEEHLELLSRLGMEVEPFGGNTFAVKSIPPILQGADLPNLLHDIAQELSEGAGPATITALENRILASMACHGSVRAHQHLSTFEIRALLKDLDKVDFSVCAHGRPVAVRMEATEIQARFHR